MVGLRFQEGARSSSGRTAILLWAWRRRCASFWVSLAQPALSATGSLFPVPLRRASSGLVLEDTKGREQQHWGVEPRRAAWGLSAATATATAATAAARPAECSTPAPTEPAPHKGPLTCFRAHSGPHQILSCPHFSRVFVMGEGSQAVTLPDIYCICFPKNHVAQHVTTHHFCLCLRKPRWALSLGSVFVCSVMNTLFCAKHSLFCMLFY